MGVSLSGSQRTLALRDFYPYWRSMLEAPEGGKVLPVPKEGGARTVFPVMFDDNIGRPGGSLGAHIVDVRDVSTGRAVPFEEAWGAGHLVRADPLPTLVPSRLPAPVIAPGKDCLVDDSSPFAGTGSDGSEGVCWVEQPVAGRSVRTRGEIVTGGEERREGVNFFLFELLKRLVF
ncbi:unnamed protein product [Discosporangium mesarthrocarpum]